MQGHRTARTSGARTRLGAAERRQQLIQLGLEMLSDQPRELVAVDRIAEAAGISRGLLFHYFPTKRAYHVAVVQAAADRMLTLTAPDPQLALIDRLRAGLRAYIAFVTDNQALYTSLVRGAAGGDEELQEIFDRTRAAIVDRVVESVGMTERSPVVRTALRGWVGFVEESTLDWLRHRDLGREALIDLQEQTLIRSIETAAVAAPAS